MNMSILDRTDGKTIPAVYDVYSNEFSIRFDSQKKLSHFSAYIYEVYRQSYDIVK